MRLLKGPISERRLRKMTCRCGAPATEQFHAGMCADTSKGKGRWIPVCDLCDMKINSAVLLILYGDTQEVRDMIEAYARRER